MNEDNRFQPIPTLTYNYFVNQPCQNSHVFTWTGGNTDDKPNPSLRCDCGAIRYGDVFRDEAAPED